MITVVFKDYHVRLEGIAKMMVRMGIDIAFFEQGQWAPNKHQKCVPMCVPQTKYPLRPVFIHSGLRTFLSVLNFPLYLFREMTLL